MESINQELEVKVDHNVLKISMPEHFITMLLPQLYDGNYYIKPETYETVTDELLNNLNITNIEMYLQTCVSYIIEHCDKVLLTQSNIDTEIKDIRIKMNTILRKYANEINRMIPGFRYKQGNYAVVNNLVGDEIIIKYSGQVNNKYASFIPSIVDLSKSYPLPWKTPEYCHPYGEMSFIDDFIEDAKNEGVYDAYPRETIYEQIEIFDRIPEIVAKQYELDFGCSIETIYAKMLEKLSDKTVYTIGQYARLSISNIVSSFSENKLKNSKLCINYDDILIKNNTVLEKLLLVFRIGNSWFRAYPNNELKRFDVYYLRPVYNVLPKVTWFINFDGFIVPIIYEKK